MTVALWARHNTACTHHHDEEMALWPRSNLPDANMFP